MGFERCHPAVNFLYFTTVITGMLMFVHPVFLMISFGVGFIYSIKRNGWRSLVFNLAVIPAVIGFAFYYSSYHHFGVTVLDKNMIGNSMTLESLVYGHVEGLRIAGFCIWFSCVHSVISTDKVVYLFGRLWPRLSMFLAIALRMIPRIKKKACQLHTARKGIGRGYGQGHFFRRIRNSLCILSALVTWTLEALATVSDSMRSRGSSLRRRRAFSLYRFDHRDRAYVITMFLCLTLTVMGVLLGQTDMQYDPRLRYPAVTPMSWVFFLGYALLCLMPMGLELWTQWKYYRVRKCL